MTTYVQDSRKRCFFLLSGGHWVRFGSVLGEDKLVTAGDTSFWSPPCVPCVCISSEEEGLAESHVFYQKVPPGFFGSKKPRRADEVCVCECV